MLCGVLRWRCLFEASLVVMAFRFPWVKEKKSFSFIKANDLPSSVGGLVYGRANSKDIDNNSIVMACCMWAGRNIQQAPITTYDAANEILPDEPASWLVRYPQRRVENRTKYTGRQLISSVLISAMLQGDAYVQILRNGGGVPIGLDYLPFATVTPVTMAGDNRIVAYYQVGSQRVKPEDMITFPLFGLDDDRPFAGRDPLRSAAQQILTDNRIAQYSKGVTESPNPRMAFVPKDSTIPITQEDADILQKKISDSLGGRNAGRAIVSNFPADITPFSFSPDQMAIDVLNKLPETRIPAVFGIPPMVLHLLAGLERSTFSNMSEARESATEEFLVPMWTQIAECFGNALGDDFDFERKRLEMRFNLAGVRALNEDVNDLHKRTREDFTANLISRATALRKIGEAPQAGDENVYAWQLKVSPAVPDLPQGPDKAKQARDAAENS